VGVTTASGLERISEGREAEVFALANGHVLRVFREARPRFVLEREVAAMAAARAVMPSVPEVYGVSEFDGRPAMEMERVDGPDLLAGVGERPWTVWRAGAVAGELQARLHAAVAPAALEDVKARVDRMLASPLVPAEVAVWARSRLGSLPDGDRILHGDYHPANVLDSPRGPVVIDWPNATRGDPDADVARSLLMLRLGEPPPGSPLVIRLGAKALRPVMIAAYTRAYRRVRAYDARAVEAWVSVRACDRLAEGIAEERGKLLAVVGKAMRRGE